MDSVIKKTGFKIETIIESTEAYEKYLLEKINITDEIGNPYEYPNMTIMFKTPKIELLKK